MKPEQQRIAIAEACGWKMSTETVEHTDGYQWTETRKFWVSPTGKRDNIPDYLNDLNAMHEAEKALSSQDKREYAFQINGGCYTSGLDDTFNIVHATAAERAEAFLRTLDLWKQ